MGEDVNFERFKSLCLGILQQSGNCEASRKLFDSARSIPQLVTAWLKFGDGLVHEVPNQVIAAFAEYYNEYKDEINKAAFYYNENPPEGSLSGFVLIGNGDEPISIYGSHRIYVLGNVPVNICGHCKGFVGSNQSRVYLRDYVSATVECGHVECFDKSHVIGKGDISCHDMVTATVSGGTLQDFGHRSIKAFNDAVVYSFTKKRIVLFDNAKINIRKTI